MNDSELKTFLEKYELHEQALLLLTRRELGENEKIASDICRKHRCLHLL